ncbi:MULTISPECIES: Holliday junction resolvase RuvX [unclassified Leptolyngbya]|uniref:Holliday junction resolvase RuvX n=1 Tax=unclassified Leptolyngbya TaxID=2650499 RepID=UPI001682B4D6|nr:MULTISPECIES: Holliday junction resolvase RuvX [unclassified Leptolyngbya]MBD1912812.1 Holliday junction resolvase RuvX [Leptolyngbya sp. FACHB-8]MBD2157759.1 Holliday junction resolvase RuvX [Leptolyngbya sp. FACHB-16]
MGRSSRISALGLDVGRKRIGIAGCDGTGLIATGLTTIQRTSFVEDLAKIGAIAQERQAEILVIGLPYTMQGELGAQARQVQKFADRLSKALNMPITYMDERLSSHEAEQMLVQEGRSLQYDKGLIDRKAAALILQRWLDERREKLSQKPSAINSESPLNPRPAAEPIS